MADLRAQFDSAEANVWITAWDCLPDSVNTLASIGKISTKKAYAARRKMTALGWMVLRSHGRKVRPVALIPHVTQEKMAPILKEEYEAAFNKAEFLMKRCLDLAVHCENFIEHARLEILKNITGEPMEFDRYHREKVAFEFNGPQHLGVTEKFTAEMAALEPQSRDTRKVWLCEKAEIIPVRIYVADLHHASCRDSLLLVSGTATSMNKAPTTKCSATSARRILSRPRAWTFSRSCLENPAGRSGDASRLSGSAVAWPARTACARPSAGRQQMHWSRRGPAVQDDPAYKPAEADPF